MSASIWTRCEGRSSVARLSCQAWRVVEGQHRVATLKLVDSLEEQTLLEELLEAHKPARPPGPEFDGLHYLLATPFRYLPLRYGSRFGTRFERSIWYGALEVLTCLAEVAYYRLLFLEGTMAKLDRVATEHSSFHVQVQTGAGLDLTRKRFQPFRDTIASPSSYHATQALGRDMRANGVDAFVYPSARDPRGGHAVGVFSPKAFATKRPSPRALPTWHCLTTRSQVIFRRRDLLRDESVAFARTDFTVGGVLPAPAT